MKILIPTICIILLMVSITKAETYTYSGYDKKSCFVSTVDSFYFENDSLLAFPDLQTTSCPLFPGSFVNPSQSKKGAKLDFLLIKDECNIGSPLDFCNCVCFTQVNNPCLLIGFSRCRGGSGSDIGNILFVINVGGKNTNLINPSNPSKPSEIPAPEPIVLIPVIGAGCVLAYIRRKRFSVSN